MLCLCSCSSWGWACQGPKHVEDSSVTYMLLLNCALKLVEEIIPNNAVCSDTEHWRCTIPPPATVKYHKIARVYHKYEFSFSPLMCSNVLQTATNIPRKYFFFYVTDPWYVSTSCLCLKIVLRVFNLSEIFSDFFESFKRLN